MPLEHFVMPKTKKVLLKMMAQHKDTGGSWKMFPWGQVWENLSTKIIKDNKEL